jgi:hypothetical protein
MCFPTDKVIVGGHDDWRRLRVQIDGIKPKAACRQDWLSFPFVIY